MIAKQDILDRAVDWGVRAEVVEIDYVLGWLLAPLSEQALREGLTFMSAMPVDASSSTLIETPPCASTSRSRASRALEEPVIW